MKGVQRETTLKSYQTYSITFHKISSMLLCPTKGLISNYLIMTNLWKKQTKNEEKKKEAEHC